MMQPSQIGLADCPRVWFDEIDSTSEEAARRAAQGEHGPVWLVAGAQSAARGRRGRSWASPKGNVFATALFPFPGPMADASRVCFAAGLAVVEAVETLSPVRGFQLKWPNDVQVGTAKLAGILIETGEMPESGTHGRTRWMAIGIGINLVSAPSIAGRSTTCLTALGGPRLAPLSVVAMLGEYLDVRIGQVLGGAFDALRKDWMGRAFGIDQIMTWEVGGQIRTGRFIGIDDVGAAILMSEDGVLQRVTAGDVSVVGQ